MISTSIGSTGWSLSYGNSINLNDESLQCIFIGGIHKSSSFIMSRKPIQISLELKNPSINSDAVRAYNQTRVKLGLLEEDTIISKRLLEILFGSRVIIDGKLITFQVSQIEIYPHLSIPFLILPNNSFIEKARKITRSAFL